MGGGGGGGGGGGSAWGVTLLAMSTSLAPSPDGLLPRLRGFRFLISVSSLVFTV